MPMKITPVLVVEEIESCLPFWVDRMGFQNVAQVPEGDGIGFAILEWSNRKASNRAGII